jgi:hypothetical protein
MLFASFPNLIERQIMNYYEEIHSEETRGFLVTTSIRPEDIHPRDLFDYSQEEIEDLCEKIDRDYYSWFCVRVEVRKRGVILGTDYLGGCLYENPKDFIQDAYYEDMVNNAIEDAKNNLKNINQECLIEQPLLV